MYDEKKKKTNQRTSYLILQLQYPRVIPTLTYSLPKKELKDIYRTKNGTRTKNTNRTGTPKDTESKPNGNQRNTIEPQRTETKDRTHRTHRPQPLKKLPKNYIIILRNTVTGKAAIGPLNTSNSKIIAVLTPQEELTVTNAEIK